LEFKLSHVDFDFVDARSEYPNTIRMKKRNGSGEKRKRVKFRAVELPEQKLLAFKMELDRCALRFVHVLLVAFGASTTTVTPPPLTSETIDTETTVELTTGTIERDAKLSEVPLTEQVMSLSINVSDQPDVDPEGTGIPDASVDRNRVIRDIAYYIRAHKFREFDRRYYKSAEEAQTNLYEDFPRPNLRNLHWEVRKHCAASFIECLKYLERKLRLTELRREDDTVTVMLQQNWKMPENSEQIIAVQNYCLNALKRDDLSAAPFQGPIGKYSAFAAISRGIGTQIQSRSICTRVCGWKARTSIE